MRLALLALIGVAQAAPYPEFAKAPRLVLPVSPYTDDPTNWTPPRVGQALFWADGYLDRCAIDLEAGPLLPPRHRDVRWGESLRRTEDPLEIVLLLYDAEEPSTYPIAGVAAFRGWRVEAPWSSSAPAIAALAAQGRPSVWPKPDSDLQTGQAWAALMWAITRGWATPEPAITAAHCGRMRKRITAMRARHAKRLDTTRRREAAARRAAGENARWRARSTWRFHQRAGPQRPEAMLVAPVGSRESFAVALRNGGRWDITIHGNLRTRRGAEQHQLPASGRGVALAVLGRVPVLVEQAPTTGMVIRPDGPTRLPGCGRVLTTGVLRGRTTELVVVCDNGVHQGAETMRHTPLRARWATLTQWGPGRARLLLGGDGVQGFVLKADEAPEPWTPPAAVAAMGKAHPTAPIWAAPGNVPVQATKTHLHGLGKPRPIGDARLVFHPETYYALRVRETKRGTTLRLDDVYSGRGWTTDLPAGAMWAVHGGDYDPLVLALTKAGKDWVIAPPKWREAK